MIRKTGDGEGKDEEKKKEKVDKKQDRTCDLGNPGVLCNQGSHHDAPSLVLLFTDRKKPFS